MRRLKSPMGLAVLIVIALSIGTATAATQLITGKEIKDHSITGREIKRKSIPLSALRTQAPATAGTKGEKGDEGDIGLTGEPGAPGVSALTESFSIEGEIPALVAPSTDWQFLGSDSIPLFGGDRGQLTAAVTIGTNDATIDSEADFVLGICFSEEGEPVEPFSSTGAGMSPVLESGDRSTITLTATFSVDGDPAEGLEAEVGPCVLNQTTSDLDENDRYQGSVLVAAA